MKILTLEINNIRGIPNFEHDFQGKNAVILGPNGMGKSSILDAIDFLLTGDIARLKGEGTSGISLKHHGTHVDSVNSVSLGTVKALVQFERHSEPRWISRSIREPEKLTYPDEVKTQMRTVSQLAGQGQHMLTRRQMLQFISVAPQRRADQIAALLNLQKVRETRSNLVSVKNTLERKKDDANSAREASQSDLASVFSLARFDSDTLLNAINENRAVLELEPIEELCSSVVDRGIGHRHSVMEESLSPTLLREQAKNVMELTTESSLAPIRNVDLQLREALEQVRSNPELLHALSQQELLQLGLDLIDDNACPLCDKYWEKDDLANHIRWKISTATDAKELLNHIKRLEEELRQSINAVLSGLSHLTSTKHLVSRDKIDTLSNWESLLTALRNGLNDSRQTYPAKEWTSESVAVLFTDVQIRRALADINDRLTEIEKRIGIANEEQKAFERLTRAKSDLERLDKRERDHTLSKKEFSRSVQVLNKFLLAHDEVLEDLYDDISRKLTCLYRELHEDETTFAAELRSTDSGTRFNVDFYGRGMFPPNALHSEGHQDSMGLCLFLVLSEKLSGSNLKIMLLDDVVTSIDVGHRKELARLIQDGFNHRQIIVATHDTSWFKQLKALGFASKSNTLQIVNWEVQSGPCFLKYKDEWDKIERDLAEHDVGAASAKLRRWAESFFRNVCQNFQAPVRFRLHGDWTLGDLIDPARKAFTSYLKKAKTLAQTSSHKELFATIQNVDSHRKQVYARLGIEEWAVNAAVHFNEWENLSPDEFKDVVDAFQDFRDLLHCDKCSRLLHISDDKDLILCGCGNVLWPLPQD